MNRRNILLILGALAMMTGIVFGTGAFTQVEADRNVTVSLADDSDALLALNATSENPEYVSTVAGGAGQQVVEINLDGTGVPGAGVNDDAVTNVTPVLNVTNQGTQAVNITLSNAPAGIAFTNAPNNLAVGDTGQVGIEVAVGDAPRNVNGGTLSGNVDQAVTIRAEATP